MNKWWQDAVVYQIYPMSFADFDGDGTGDLRGITAKLDYIASLGVNVIWLSPIYASPMDDNGYDISDYRAVNPLFGTMADMDRLIAEAEVRNIKIIMDLVINHTSDEHEWFVKSRDKNSPYRDFYFWRPGKKGKMPNNWGGFFGGKAWQKDEESGEYYLHLFSKKQPDLNYHNPRVIAEIKDIMRFWLDKGIAGFRCDVINIIWKNSLDDGKRQIALQGIEHYLTAEGTHAILKELRREVLANYDCFTVGETVLVTTKDANDLCAPERGELDMVFQFEQQDADQILVKWFRKKFNSEQFFRTLTRWQTEVAWNANYLENHDQPRSVSRYCKNEAYRESAAKMLAILLFTLRGTPFVYQGEEIGMTNFDFTDMDQLRDVESHNIYKLAKKLGFPASYRWKMMKNVSRDNARTPMQWTAGENAGFTAGKPWLGINANHKNINVEDEEEDPDSVLNFYRRMIAVRAAEPALLSGSFEKLYIKKGVFVYARTLGTCTVKTALNFSDKPAECAESGELIIAGSPMEYFDGKLSPWQGVVFK